MLCKWDMFIVLCASFQNAYFCDGVGVVGVAGTQHCTQANERTQRAAYRSNKILFHRPNQHKYNGQMRANIHSAGRKEIKQTVQSFRSSEQLNQQLCVSSAVFNYRSLSNYITK